jgi:hypothetical protein
VNLRLTGATALPVAVAIFALAGCSMPFASPAAKASAATDPRQAMLQFTQCMRQHGINMPDPDSSGRVSVHSGTGSDGASTDGSAMTDPNDPKFQAAQTACQKYMPSGGRGNMSPQDLKAEQAKGLKFSQCMRAHGLPSFPDPQSNAGGGNTFQKSSGSGGGGPSGGMFINGQSFTGFDPTAPEFQKAQDACISIMGVKGAPSGSGGGPAGSGTSSGAH